MKKLVILLATVLMGATLLTGCKSKEEKKIEKKDAKDRKQVEELMTVLGANEEEVEEILKEVEKEQETTREDRAEAEKQREIEKAKEEEEIRKEQEKFEAERKAEKERLEAERLEQERIAEEKRIAEETAWKEREDFMNGIVAQQVGGLSYKIEKANDYIMVRVINNDPNLLNSVIADTEDVNYTTIKQNITPWSGEMKEKYAKQFKENTIVRYYYYAGEEWVATAEDGFVASDYLRY